MNIDDIQYKCRLCLMKPEDYEDALFDNQLKENLKLIFKIDVEYDQKYSSLICKCCLQTLQTVCEFYHKVLANQKVLEHQAKLLEIKNKVLNEETSVSEGMNYNFANSFHSDNDEMISEDDKMESTEDPSEKSSDSDYEPEKKLNPISKKLRKKLKPSSKKLRKTNTNYEEQIQKFVSLVCDQCVPSEVFDTFKELTEHYKMIHKCRGYVTCCDKRFYRKDSLATHITNHIDPEAYKCSECGKTSKNRSCLQIHMKIHLPVETREFPCCICTKRFTTKSRLAIHEKSHLSDSEKKFSCDECGKVFAIKQAVTRHKQIIHSFERHFVCEECGQSFTMKTNLQYHIDNIHSNEAKPKLQCHLCQAWLKNKHTLRKHIRRHKDQTEYKCEHCNKLCSSRGSLYSHIRFVHKDVRKHECNVCERKFRRKFELADHMAKHTGQPLHTCQNCLRSFIYSQHFALHRKKCQ